MFRAIQSAFEIKIVQFFVMIVAVTCQATENVNGYHVPLRKKQERLARDYLKGLKL